VPRSRARFGSRLLILALVAAAALALPVAVAAHPLGNLTINHYAGVHVRPGTVLLDVVLDFAEIPAFQERQRMDTDGDDSVSDAETEAERLGACDRLAGELDLRAAGQPLALRAWAAGVSFPPGLGGLPTMRIACQFEALLAVPLDPGTPFDFADRSHAARIGWREIVVIGEGTTIAGDVTDETLSERLTAYPEELLAQPLAVGEVQFTATPGEGAPPAYQPPTEVMPLPGQEAPLDPDGSVAPSADPAAPSPSAVPAPTAPGASVPGGIPDDIGALIGATDLSPLAIVGTLLVAAGLGAAHALSPGHGKTVMAAYLVGTRGSARHAVGLGLTVTISHTAGVFALAALTLLASSQFPPDRLYPALQLLSGLIVVAIGAWLLWGQLRAYIARREATRHVPPHDHDHSHDASHAHEHPHPDDEPEAHPHEHPADDPFEHSHGGVRHSHVPAPGTQLSWRSLVSLGLAGGLVPSISALAILLGSLQAQRPAYGLVLVVAFGVGMAIVLAGIGVALVYASRLVERVSFGSGLARLWAGLPLATAVVVIVAGVYLTSQAFSIVF
jgi:nickel/cobalt transporter (NicO) family protein